MRARVKRVNDAATDLALTHIDLFRNLAFFYRVRLLSAAKELRLLHFLDSMFALWSTLHNGSKQDLCGPARRMTLTVAARYINFQT